MAGASGAQMFKDPALQALQSAERFTELEALAQQRIAQHPDDAQAVLGLGIAVLREGDAHKRETAIAKAQACIAQQPQAAECHYALGTVMGIHAMSQGMLKAATSAGTVKAALQEALRLAPGWFPARSAMVEFYLAAPGVMGGSASKAADLARSAPRPEQAQALQARVALNDDQFDTALPQLFALQAGSDTALAEDVLSWIYSAAFSMLGDKKVAQARPVFERIWREHPQKAVGAYGLGRVQHELGAYPEAIRLFEQAARLQGAALFGVDYRLGLALLANGQPEPARAALARCVAAGKGSPKALDDAKKRLSQLPGA
jgi:tetratricopeptide (TPR) repeat protein